MRKIFLLCLITLLCPLLMAEEAPVPSSAETDAILNDAMTAEKPVEKQQRAIYKKAKIKKIKKKAIKKVKKIKKVRVKNAKAQSGM